jgi:hypothetical protein
MTKERIAQLKLLGQDCIAEGFGKAVLELIEEIDRLKVSDSADVEQWTKTVVRQTAETCADIAYWYDRGGKPERGIRTHFALAGFHFGKDKEDPCLLDWLSFGARKSSDVSSGLLPCPKCGEGVTYTFRTQGNTFRTQGNPWYVSCGVCGTYIQEYKR